MKKRPSLIILISTLTLLNGGCGSPSENQAPPLLSPSMSPNTTAPPPIPSPPSPQAAASPSPKASPSNPKVIGLIPSTNPTRRRQEILSGRTNPFALIGINVLVKPDTLPSTSPSGESGKAETSANLGSVDRRGIKEGAGNQLSNSTIQKGSNFSKTGVLVASKPQVKPKEQRVGTFCSGQSPDQQIVQKISGFNNIQPEDAQGVVVSGIIKFRNTPAAILLPHGESLEITVQPGAMLSQGKVKVVAIDTLNESVVLQQYGKIVSRKIGDKPVVIKSESASDREIVTRPQGPDGFGLVRGLMLDKVSLDKVKVGEKDDSTSRRLFGTLCNDSKKAISFNEVKVQIQDAKTNNILDVNWNKINESDATLEPGQRIEFDFEVPKLRGREAKDIYVKFMNWR
jgi:cold shock CspA family protein